MHYMRRNSLMGGSPGIGSYTGGTNRLGLYIRSRLSRWTRIFGFQRQSVIGSRNKPSGYFPDRGRRGRMKTYGGQGIRR